jgi:cyclic beta-1,2-glucan synthetase
MKLNTIDVDKLLVPIKSYFKKDSFTHKEVDENPPLRSTLLSEEQMDWYAQQLAIRHTISLKEAPELLLKALSDNEDILVHVNGLLKKSVSEKRTISPAGEWLLDNFYLIDEQIRIGKRYLPKGYSKGLPKLENGFPRVYGIAIEIVSHSDGHIDIQSLSNFIRAYQKESDLTLGELWAIPIMLRLALLENLSRVAAGIAVDRKDSALANKWARRILSTTENSPKDLVLVIADMARSNPPMVSAFVAEFARKLQWKGPELTLPLNWVELHLSGTDDTINSMVLRENQKQAANQVSVSNSINSLRFLAKMDWREFVETMSVVEQILRKDINRVYTRMDFYTRDDYRHKVEEIAKSSHLNEKEVAEIAIDLARQSFHENSEDKRKAHVGYYLIKEGVNQTRRAARTRLSAVQWLRKMMVSLSPKGYTLTAILITVMLGGGMLIWAAKENIGTGWLIVMAALSVFSASHLAIALTNWLATIWIKPKPLPRLDFSLRIPNEYRTIVVVPTLLGSTRQVEKLLEELEVRFLANRDPNLLFALLTDFYDAPSQTMPEDDAIIQLAQKRIEALNKHYGRESNDTFFLFHRPRSWNAVDNLWMGYERKRGKLSDLNQLLRGKSKNCFSVIVGDERIYTSAKYVITLDTDTQLPREAAWKLVGLMAHPLNKPLYDEKKRRVTEGYTIIQPRIAISLHGATRSGYSLLHENDAGIDPYTRVTSDVYQDVFEEGSYIGKGIYEIDAFEKALHRRFPEHRILSHDLLEGSYARCGFASDVQFYEVYPSRYSMDSSRRHRWIRGDWQIANWFLPIVPGPDKKFKKNSISALSRWKIFDNLRRSLVPVVFMLLLMAGWTVLSSPWFWSLAILAIFFIPSLITSIWNLLWKPKEVGVTQHITNATTFTSKNILQTAFTVMCLPYDAFLSMDAIIRTLWRVNISGRKLLEWNPSGFTAKKKEDLLTTYRTMWIAPVLGMGMFSYLLYTASPSLFIAAPFLVVWILSPAVVSALGQPIVPSKSTLRDDQKLYLRELSRKTWSFFEDLVGPEDNWLPPDNLQKYPAPVIAHRTSPTNIGLSLLANLSACDFGYATTTQLIERTENTFATLEKLERYKGHFYNWYDTQNLKTLHPRYVSTVDSGNLAGLLLTLRQGLLAIPHQKIIMQKFLYGLQDTLRIAINEISANEKELRATLHKLYETIEMESFQLPSVKKHVSSLLAHYRKLAPQPHTIDKENWWLRAFEKQLEAIDNEITFSAPWLNTLPIPEKFKDWKVLYHIPTLLELTRMDREVKPELTRLLALENSATEEQWLSHFEESVDQASTYARERVAVLQDLGSKGYEFADMEYDFLYDKAQRLLTIGYNVDEYHRDTGFYDLLASEARLSLFVAIAQGKLSQESWFALGRRLTTAGTTPVLISWSGSMFEYLMPGLIMPTYENTLLNEMCIGIVKKQMEYGEQQGVPWGISESCYNLVDAHLTYQYKAFGIPELGFKSGLGLDLVIAPYATVLALMVDPQAACSNLERMKANGFEGRYGFYESIDYTPARLLRGQTHAVIQTFMTHHQGMGLLSLAYLLLDQPMQKRFEADKQFQTAMLLLQERVPKAIGFYSGPVDNENLATVSTTIEIRVIKTPDTPVPEVQLLSNGQYFVMITNAGGGYSRWRGIALTRWREDSTCDNWGTFCYINDRDRDAFWSMAHQPTLKKADHYEAIFLQGRVEFRRRDDDIETYTVIVVSPEDDVEVRRVHLTNHSRLKKNLEVTSYREVVLAEAAGDDTHPAFSNLFVQTEINEHQHAIVCTRRPRSADERPPWMFHLMKANGVEVNQVSYETDRSKFIGRGYTLAHPQVMDQTAPLSGSQGSVLDPIVSIQYRVTLQPDESVIIDLVTGVAENAQDNQRLIDKYQDSHLRDRAFELAWTHSHVALRQIGITEADAQLYSKLASSVLYLNPALRARPNIILKNLLGQSALWSYSISGDLPIVLVQIADASTFTLVNQLIKAQAYWHMNGLAVDVIILNEDPSGYRQLLQDQIQGLVAAGVGVAPPEKQGRIFVRPIDQVSTEDLILLQTVARIIISDTKGTLEDQLNKRAVVKTPIPKLSTTRSFTAHNSGEETTVDGLQFFNGTGGFSGDGKEYVMVTEGAKKSTPLPWINVMANPHFGTIVSERGSSYTWFENAHEFRLTPWKNDPVQDGCGEAFYLRDEETGQFWSPMGQPAQSKSPYITKHGFGYSTFEHREDGILSDVCMYVDLEAPVKFIVIKIVNQSGRTRKLTATGYVEWILTELRAKSVMHIVTELDSVSGALMARNPFNMEFQNRVAFFDVDSPDYTYTTDRSEFIGRNGTLQHPEAMNCSRLSGKSGAGLDPCAALQVPFELENEKERKIIFKLGAANNQGEAVATIQRFRGSAAASHSLDQVTKFWTETLGAVHIETPDPSINILANGWLHYQVLSARLWGRSGFYQSGGAYGFRDQLQDVLALLHTRPELTRQQILTCAARQFIEGDVQHWWHPPHGRGVRTLCSDDFLWLPFVTSRYVSTTGDYDVLDEQTHFLQGRQLNTYEESYYDLPITSGKRASLYDHCKQAIVHALRFGEHGLPLMGSGDWNDGMNRVGIHGIGESVWLAFFLYDVLNRFLPLAVLRGDEAFVALCNKHAALLKKNINLNAWDGAWYLRAFFDDGSPLGSKKNTECKIDAIAQSWSVLSAGGEADRSRAAMDAVNAFLINREKGLIQLLEPPFDKADMDPGYIKGYVPGVRENGGQYTHAAIWTVMAFAKLGDTEKTEELLKLINPVNHGATPDQIATYKVEPYVMAADVYGVTPHTGRGGWTWYTGSAGWMYQLILESFLGLKRTGNQIKFEPCIPRTWKSFTVQYRFKETLYAIKIIQEPHGAGSSILVDGVRQQGDTFQLVNDKQEHVVIFSVSQKKRIETF